MSAPEQTGLAGEEQLSAMIIMAKAVTGAGAASFTAGEVSVRERDAGEVARVAQSLRETAEHLMSPYIDPQQFQFRSVQG